MNQVNIWHHDGLISTSDATEIVRGHRPLTDFPQISLGEVDDEC